MEAVTTSSFIQTHTQRHTLVFPHISSLLYLTQLTNKENKQRQHKEREAVGRSLQVNGLNLRGSFEDADVQM